MLPQALLDAALAALARLVLVGLRLTPLTVVLPFLGGRALPLPARLPLLAVLAIGAMPALLAAPVPEPLTPWIVAAAAREVTVGLVLALLVATPLFALEQGGRLLDAARGANVAEVVAPDTGARSSPLSELLRWTFGVVFLAAGGLRALVRVVAASLEAVPPDLAPRGALATGRLADAVARWTAVALGASVTLVSAGLLALLAVELVLGVAARLSPPLAQSNLALPLRALGPLLALALTVGLWTGAAQDLARRVLGAAAALAW